MDNQFYVARTGTAEALPKLDVASNDETAAITITDDWPN